MATALQLRRGTTAQHASFTGAAGEVTVDTNKNTVVVHDGSTAGGHPLAIEQGAISSVSWDSSLDTYPSVAEFPSGPCAIHDKIRRCIVNDSGSVVYYLDGLDSTKTEAGGTAVLNGSVGQVMVEIPKFFVKKTKVGNLNTWWISDKKQAGFTVHPAFVKNGTEVAARYVGAYDACLFDATDSTYKSGLNYDDNTGNIDTVADKLGSVSGIYPMVGITRAEARLLAANRGTGWRQLDFYLMSAIQLLYLVEYRSFNSQFTISNGNTRHTSWPASSGTQTDSRANVAGLSNALGNRTGGSSTGTINTANNGDYMSYRGIENWFGNVWNWADGINVINRQAYLSNTDTQFADDTTTNYAAVGTTMPSSNNYITNIQDLANVFLPSSVGGSSTTYITDYYVQNTGNRVVGVGGAARDGAVAGGFVLSAFHVSSVSGREFGARLAF